jgi:hypothetical protein
MVVFLVNREIQDILKAGNCALEIVSHEDGSETVSHLTLLKGIDATGANCSLASLIRGAEVHATHREAARAHARVHSRNPELVARLARIRIANENKEYGRMVRDVVRPSSTNAEAEEARLGRIGSQMSIGANVIITMITCFVAGYFVFKHSSGRESVALTGGIACMIAAMCVEAILVITRMYSIQSAAESQKNQRIAGHAALA